LLTGIPKLSIKDNRAFAVLDHQAQAPRIYSSASELGFYFNDTRHVGAWEMTINGESPVPLQNELRDDGNTVVVSMTNRDLTRIDRPGRISRDLLLIRRILTLVNDQVYETIEIKNFDFEPHTLQIEFWSGGKFDDIFEVRGFARIKRGTMLPALEERSPDGKWTMITHQYRGLDDVVRKTCIRRYFDVEKIRVSPAIAGYFTRVQIPSKEAVSLRAAVGFNKPPIEEIIGKSFISIPTVEMMDSLENYRDKEPASGISFECDNAIVNRSIKNALTDIYMLLTREDDGTLYPYAGIPWFSAPFGRDGLITAYQMLPWAPQLAKGVLTYAFGCLGSKVDPFTDEQPGKVFHEMRRGEMSGTREVPFLPYYGSVDSTPLALILLQEYIRWTHDLESLRVWWPQALRALEWIERWGDSNGDGFLDYAKQSPTGLVNQGWKDSYDSVMHANGRLAEVPISLCEVQGYSFRAKSAMADLASLMGDTQLGTRLRFEALQLRHKFVERYWDGERQIIYLALDGQGKPCAVRSSNMGQCLWSEILTPHQAGEIAKHLMSDAMFSGYGIRTLADTEVAYNPLSYHNGSIWPHDNSLIMEGFRKYGLIPQLDSLSTGLLNVLETSEDFRLPELFCGFRRRGNAPPIPYEVACKPQAWAAGSIFLMLKSMLGISMDAHQSYVVFNSPILTSKINHLEIKGLRGRDWEMDLAFRRTRGGVSVDVIRKTGSVRVLTVKS
jgi:glycogen debranching enzyme